MRLLDAETVHRLLDWPSLVEALRAAHRGDMPTVGECVLTDPGAGAADRHFLLLPAWRHGDGLGVKLVTVFPENRDRPSVQGLFIAFDATTGAPRLVADGAALTARKTAADSALGADLLARPDAARLVMIGAGALAPHVIAAMIAVRPTLREVTIWNRTPERAGALAARLDFPGVRIAATSDLESALARADIVSAATMATQPLVRGALLSPGVHVDLIGGWRPDMREADDEAIRRALVHVDCRALCRDCGDVAGPLASGALDEAGIRGDLFDLVAGRAPGRTRADEITLFKNAGGGHLDLFSAALLAERTGSDLDPAAALRADME